VKRDLLQVFEQDTAMTMQDALGLARCAGGEQYPEGVIELDRDGCQSVFARARLGPLDDVGCNRDISSDAGNHDGPPKRGQVPAQLLDRIKASVGAAGIVVAVRRDKHGGFKLPEAGQCSLGGVLLAAYRPYRTDAGCREEGHDRLRDIWHVSNDPVPLLNAEPAQCVCDSRDLAS